MRGRRSTARVDVLRFLATAPHDGSVMCLRTPGQSRLRYERMRECENTLDTVDLKSLRDTCHEVHELNIANVLRRSGLLSQSSLSHIFCNLDSRDSRQHSHRNQSHSAARPAAQADHRRSRAAAARRTRPAHVPPRIVRPCHVGHATNVSINPSFVANRSACRVVAVPVSTSLGHTSTAAHVTCPSLGGATCAHRWRTS